MKIRSVQFVKSGTATEDFPPDDLPEIAIAGRSNVGKSSLINSLVGRHDIARVSKTPGRTRLLNWFSVNEAIRLCDLPGYGYAKVSRDERASWSRMVDGYLHDRTVLRALVVICDVRRGFGEEELELVRAASALDLQAVLVATKCDRLRGTALYNAKAAVARPFGLRPESPDIVWYSSETGEGRDRLWARIRALAGLAPGG